MCDRLILLSIGRPHSPVYECEVRKWIHCHLLHKWGQNNPPTNNHFPLTRCSLSHGRRAETLRHFTAQNIQNPLASLFYNCLLNNMVFKACLMCEQYFVPLRIFAHIHIHITTYKYRPKLFWIHFKANETQPLLMKKSLIGIWKDRSYYTLHFIQHISLGFLCSQVSPTHTEILIRHKSLSFVSTYVMFFIYTWHSLLQTVRVPSYIWRPVKYCTTNQWDFHPYKWSCHKRTTSRRSFVH